MSNRYDNFPYRIKIKKAWKLIKNSSDRSSVYQIMYEDPDTLSKEYKYVSLEELNKGEFLKELWGHHSSHSTKELLTMTTALKNQFEDTPEVCHLETGWYRTPEGKRKYNHKSAIGGALPPNISLPIDLGGKRKWPKKKIEKTLKVVSQIDDKPMVGNLLISAIALAVLRPFIRCENVFALVGPSGSCKTALAATVQSFFGPQYNETNLPVNGASTPGKTIEIMYSFRDAVVIADDYTLRNNNIREQLETLNQLSRGISNNATRQRMTDANNNQNFECVPIITGERIPSSELESLMNRFLFIELDKSSINLKKLSKLQNLGKSGILANITLRYTNYLTAHWEKAKALASNLKVEASNYLDTRPPLPARYRSHFISTVSAHLHLKHWAVTHLGKKEISYHHVFDKFYQFMLEQSHLSDPKRITHATLQHLIKDQNAGRAEIRCSKKDTVLLVRKKQSDNSSTKPCSAEELPVDTIIADIKNNQLWVPYNSPFFDRACHALQRFSELDTPSHLIKALKYERSLVTDANSRQTNFRRKRIKGVEEKFFCISLPECYELTK